MPHSPPRLWWLIYLSVAVATSSVQASFYGAYNDTFMDTLFRRHINAHVHANNTSHQNMDDADADANADDGGAQTILELCGTDESVNAKCLIQTLPLMYATSRPVLRLRRNGFAHCTAFLLGDQGHLMTNHHCVSNWWEARQVRVEVMAEGATCDTRCDHPLACEGSFLHPVHQKLAFIATGKSLTHDWTLLQLPPASRAAALVTYGFLTLRRTGPRVGEAIYVPQHPRGYGKKIAYRDGAGDATIVALHQADQIVACGTDQVTYRADTQGGSSGSPVMAVSDHTVVALHHCGGCEDYGANAAINIASMMPYLEKHLPPSAFSPKD